MATVPPKKKKFLPSILGSDAEGNLTAEGAQEGIGVGMGLIGDAAGVLTADDEYLGEARGKAIGSGVGAGLGAVVGMPGVGAALGGTVGQLIGSGSDRKKADRSNVQRTQRRNFSLDLMENSDPYGQFAAGGITDPGPIKKVSPKVAAQMQRNSSAATESTGAKPVFKQKLQPGPMPAHLVYKNQAQSEQLAKRNRRDLNLGISNEMDTTNYMTEREMLLKHGAPDISYENPERSYMRNGSDEMRSYFDMENNTMHLSQTDPRNVLLAELAHAKQLKDKGVYGMRGAGNTDNLSSWWNKRSRDRDYYIPGTLEHEAHSVIEPVLTNEEDKLYQKNKKESYNRYSTGLPRMEEGGITGGPGDPTRPLTQGERQEWNSFIDFVGKKGYQGSEDLNKRDTNMGQQLFNEYRKANPNAKINYDIVPHAQAEMRQAQGFNADFMQRKGLIKDPNEVMGNVSPVDGWFGSKTSQFKFPNVTTETYKNGNLMNRQDKGLITGANTTNPARNKMTEVLNDGEYYENDQGDLVRKMEAGGIAGEEAMNPVPAEEPPKKQINVEKGEILANQEGAVIWEFDNPNRFAPHAKNQFLEPMGNFVDVDPTHIVIPKNKVKTFQEGDLITRRSILRQLVDNQVQDPNLNDPQMKKGGIHIKPENKGKFTRWASNHGMSVSEAASKVMANKEKYSSGVVKMANFARNARKFKHEEGGIVEPDMYDDANRYEEDSMHNDIGMYAPGGIAEPGPRNPYLKKRKLIWEDEQQPLSDYDASMQAANDPNTPQSPQVSVNANNSPYTDYQAHMMALNDPTTAQFPNTPDIINNDTPPAAVPPGRRLSGSMLTRGILSQVPGVLQMAKTFQGDQDLRHEYNPGFDDAKSYAMQMPDSISVQDQLHEIENAGASALQAIGNANTPSARAEAANIASKIATAKANVISEAKRTGVGMRTNKLQQLAGLEANQGASDQQENVRVQTERRMNAAQRDNIQAAVADQNYRLFAGAHNDIEKINAINHMTKFEDIDPLAVQRYTEDPEAVNYISEYLRLGKGGLKSAIGAYEQMKTSTVIDKNKEVKNKYGLPAGSSHEKTIIQRPVPPGK